MLRSQLYRFVQPQIWKDWSTNIRSWTRQNEHPTHPVKQSWFCPNDGLLFLGNEHCRVYFCGCIVFTLHEEICLGTWSVAIHLDCWIIIFLDSISSIPIFGVSISFLQTIFVAGLYFAAKWWVFDPRMSLAPLRAPWFLVSVLFIFSRMGFSWILVEPEDSPSDIPSGYLTVCHGKSPCY